MLQKIRDKSQGWISWVIISVICFTFALWGIHYYLNRSSVDTSIAKVNGRKITKQEFDMAYRRVRDQQMYLFGGRMPKNPDYLANLKQNTLQSLIATQLQVDSAESTGFRIGPQQVDNYVMNIPAFQDNGEFSKALMMQRLQQMMFSQDQFYTQLEQQLLISQLRNSYVATAFALPDEVSMAIKLVEQSRDVTAVTIPYQSFLNKNKVTQEAIKNYYQDHQDAYQSPEKVSLQYLVLSQKNIADKITPTEADIKRFYQDNINLFTQPERWKVEAYSLPIAANIDEKLQASKLKSMQNFVNGLRAGKSLNDLQAKYPDIHSTRKWLNSAAIDHAQIVKLQKTKINQYTNPVKNKNTLTVYQVLVHKPKQVASYNAVKDRAGKMLAQQQAEKVFSKKSDSLSNLTYETPDSLETAANELDLKIQTTPLFSRVGGKDKITSNSKVIQTAFSQDVLKEKYNSDVISLNEGEQVVIRLLKHQPQKALALDKVKTEIQQTLAEQAARQSAAKAGDALIKKAKAGKTLKQLAAEQGYQVKSYTDVSRHQQNIPPKLLQLVFQMPKPRPGKLSIKGLLLPNGDYAVVTINKVVDGSKAKLSKQDQQAFKQEIAKQLGSLDYELYLNGAENSAKIKVNAMDDMVKNTQ